MDLSDLHIFKTVVEEDGIASAARRLHRVPSNVTHRIQQLEASLSTKLFLRIGGRLHLSPEGQALIPYADGLLRMADEARRHMAKRPLRGVLRLGSLESTAATRLPQLLSRFHRDYPEVRVELLTGTNDAMTTALLKKKIDAAFVADPPKGTAFQSRDVFRERLVLITAVTNGPVQSASQLEGQSMIAFPNGCAYRRRLERWLGAARTSAVRTLDLSSYHAIVACVAGGAGFAAVPQAVLDALPTQHVAAHSIPSLSREFATPLIWRAGDEMPSLSALHEAFFQKVPG